MNRVAEVLSNGRRNWRRNAPANDNQIQELIASIDVELPSTLIDLLRFSNGGEGDLALPPMWFQLFSTTDLSATAEDEFYRSAFPDYLFFGTNGGLEMIALDKAKYLAVVMVDPIAGKDSAVQIARDADEFVNAIGIEYEENA